MVRATDAFCRSARSPPQRLVYTEDVHQPQRLPGFESGRLDQILVGELIGWRWWKVVDSGLLTFNGSRPVPTGPFEADFPECGGLLAFKRRDDAESAFVALSARWTPYPGAVTWQSQLPLWAPRVAPDAYCLGSVELWGAVHEYERGYLGQFACVTSVDRIVSPTSEPEASVALASLCKRYACRSY